MPYIYIEDGQGWLPSPYIVTVISLRLHSVSETSSKNSVSSDPSVKVDII